MKKILSIFGTRPETIKMAPVIQQLNSSPDFDSRVCVTGQHREMLDQMLQLFEIDPDHDLAVMSENQTLYDLTSHVLTKLQPILSEEKPDLVLVQGDTTTTLAASLAAYYQNIPVAHIEAGLRTHNMRAPFPEEGNRSLVSRLAQHHFAPTEQARNNLLLENIEKDRIHVTGNTVIDALLWVKNSVLSQDYSYVYGPAQMALHSGLPLILITGHRRENFGTGFESLCEAVLRMARKHSDWQFVYPVHLNPNVQSPVQKHLSNIENIYLIPPLEYAPFVKLMNHAKLIITDSGGIQEEAPSLGKPVLVTRDVTERPEAVEAGTAIIVGTDIEKIITETESLMSDQTRYSSMVGVKNPYGDGKSAQKIIEILKTHFKEDK